MTYRIAVIGNRQTGKTSCIHRMLGYEFRETRDPTEIIEEYNTCFDGINVRLYDTPGDLEYPGRVDSPDLILLFCTGSKPSTFASLPKWLVCNNTCKNIIVVVNRIDEPSSVDVSQFIRNAIFPVVLMSAKNDCSDLINMIVQSLNQV